MAGKELVAQGEARRKAILRFLRSYVAKNGYAPTIQEIADAVDLVSPNATRNHLQRLVDDGYIRMQPRIARAIILVHPAPDEVDAAARELYRAEQKLDRRVGAGRTWGRTSDGVREAYLERARKDMVVAEPEPICL